MKSKKILAIKLGSDTRPATLEDIKYCRELLKKNYSKEETVSILETHCNVNFELIYL